MATTLTGNFEVAGKVDGNNIAAADAGALTPWDTVSAAGGPTTYTSDAAHGSLAAHLTGSGYLRWEEGGQISSGPSDFYTRTIWKQHGNNALLGAGLFSALVVSARGNDSVYVIHHADGKVKVYDRGANNLVASSTNTYAFDVWHRVEIHGSIDPGDSATGSTFTVRVYDGKDDSSPTETITAANFDAGSRAAYLGLGIYGYAAENDIKYDDFVVAYGTGATWIGPVGGGTPAPTNTVAPVVSGSTVQGATLTTDNGTWTNSPTGYTYQWQRDNSGGGTFSNIGGETTSAHNTVVADVGCQVRCVVTATNAGGSASANSNALTITANPGGSFNIAVLGGYHP